jgi:hypothetical protein
MPQDLFDDTFILNEADDAHRSLAFRAKKGIDVIFFGSIAPNFCGIVLLTHPIQSAPALHHLCPPFFVIRATYLNSSHNNEPSAPRGWEYG